METCLWLWGALLQRIVKSYKPAARKMYLE
jgi:hypothetical protein